MAKVEIVDDTQRYNSAQVVTPMRARELGLSMINTRFLLVKDSQRRQVQRTVQSVKTYEGRHLDLTIKRAKRWMRGGRLRGAPKHITLAMLVFAKAEPDNFNKLLAEMQ